MSTTLAKKETLERKWYVIDAVSYTHLTLPTNSLV